MTVHQLKESLELTVLVEQEIDKEITGCYIGDLLSWAMSRIKTGDVWLTVMGNVNAIAVAVLSDAACIILTDAAALDEEAKEKAQQDKESQYFHQMQTAIRLQFNYRGYCQNETSIL